MRYSPKNVYFCKRIILYMVNKKAYKTKDWVDEQEKRGKLIFSLQEVAQQFPDLSKKALRNALTRLVGKNRIVSVLNGYYVIVPLRYSLMEIVPPVLYIDELMKQLQRPYYMALLNAAGFYGAAHQQPQQYSVISILPPLRDTTKKGIRIHFISTRKKIPTNWLRAFKTDVGYVQVSTPELTAADLITFQKEIGGLNRACTVLSELIESVDFKNIDESFFAYIPTSTIQRLGYLLENKLEQPNAANLLYEKAAVFDCKFQKIPLKYSKSTENCLYDAKWKIIVNEQIEIDEW